MKATIGQLSLSPQQRIVAWRLSEGRLVDIDELVAALYDERDDGGPLTANAVVWSTMRDLRGKLLPHGIAILGMRGHGWRVGHDQLDSFRTLLADEVLRNTPNARDIARALAARRAAVAEREELRP